jgi:hypothetical protein
MTTTLATDAATLRANLDLLPEKDRAFARSLLDAHAAGRCSEKQAHWIATLARRASGSEPKPTAIDVSGIEALLGRASAKHPAILLHTTDTARPVRISVAGPKSKTPGAIMVTGTGSFESRPYYGKITGGVFIPAGKNEPATVASVTALLLDFARDPAATASAYGRSTGVCSFCARQLTDARSVDVGYGPICADTYSLPWGG